MYFDGATNHAARKRVHVGINHALCPL
jgi:hypothetical protein